MLEKKFLVKTDVFEGPLELLLSLVEKRKLFINDISLSTVANDYIEYVKKLEDFPVGDISQFILIASTLLLIKSKSLLPTLDLNSEEESDIEDLERRLKIYQEYKRLSEYVKEKFGKEMIFPRIGDIGQRDPIFSPSEDITLQNITSALKRIVVELPKKVYLPKILIEKVINLEEIVENLLKRVKNNLKLSFREFSGKGKAGKIEVILSFLAMLELVKRNVINVSQDDYLGDISIESNVSSVPNYSGE